MVVSALGQDTSTSSYGLFFTKSTGGEGRDSKKGEGGKIRRLEKPNGALTGFEPMTLGTEVKASSTIDHKCKLLK